MKEQIVSVDWVDPCGRWQWQDRDEAEKMSTIICTTTGVLINKDKDVVRICGSTNDIGQVSDVMVIPVFCIKGKIRYIKRDKP